MFFNAVSNLRLKEHSFGAWAGTHKMIYLVTLENRAKRGISPVCGDFGPFWGISGENGVQSWPPRESKSAEKTVHPPSGVISEVLPRVDPCVSKAQINPREDF